MVLNPLAQVAIYALVLSTVISAKFQGAQSPYAYAIYLMAGIAGWSLFAELFSRSINIFIDNGNLIKKIAFPKIALPLIATGGALINNFLLLLAIFAVFTFLGHAPTLAILWLPLLTLLTLLLALGLGLILGILNVFIRDIGQITPLLLQFWFWLTPVVYLADMLPASYRQFLELNPLTSLVMGYQNILAHATPPALPSLIYPAVLAIGAILLALFIHTKASEEMADLL